MCDHKQQQRVNFRMEKIRPQTVDLTIQEGNRRHKHLHMIRKKGQYSERSLTQRAQNIGTMSMSSKRSSHDPLIMLAVHLTETNMSKSKFRPRLENNIKDITNIVPHSKHTEVFIEPSV